MHRSSLDDAGDDAQHRCDLIALFRPKASPIQVIKEAANQAAGGEHATLWRR